jgi:hypothetical protein
MLDEKTAREIDQFLKLRKTKEHSKTNGSLKARRRLPFRWEENRY